MTVENRVREPLRYRLYYWLMNASFASILFGLGGYVVEYFTGMEAYGIPASAQPIVAFPFLVLATIVPALLIALNFWRDEFAEILWKQTAANILLFFAILPPALYIGAWLAFWLGDFETAPAVISWVYEEKMLGSVLTTTWYFFTAGFVAFFQFNRWRASR